MATTTFALQGTEALPVTVEAELMRKHFFPKAKSYS